jgi:hypothetical protein
MAAFKEVAKSAGVDEHRQPTPGMVVRRGESNIVRLIGGEGLRLDKAPPPALTIEELMGPRPVTLSVRPIQRRIPSTDALVWDSQQPFDLTAMLDRINTIWIPQANVVFTCRDTTPGSARRSSSSEGFRYQQS